jgi:hypothetical protein
MTRRIPQAAAAHPQEDKMATRRTPSSSKTETTPAEKPAVTSPAKTTAASKSAAKTAPRRTQVSEDMRRGMIAQAAYLRAERRGFTGGNETEDWLAAEAEVDALLKAESRGTPQ